MASVPEGFTQGQGDNRQAEMEEQLAGMMAQILTPEAVDRLKRVELVRKEKAMEIKMKLVKQAQSGELKERVTEARLCDLLEEGATRALIKVNMQRRKYKGIDDDSDDDDSDMM